MITMSIETATKIGETLAMLMSDDEVTVTLKSVRRREDVEEERIENGTDETEYS